MRISSKAEADRHAADGAESAHLAADASGGGGSPDAFAKQVAQSKDAVQADFRFHLSMFFRARPRENRDFDDLIRYLGHDAVPRKRS